MTVGLPGTGIGGIFYLLMAICMPVLELGRFVRGKTTSFGRWAFISLQLGFVLGVISTMWVEVWLLNRLLIWLWTALNVHGPLLMAGKTLGDTKVLAFTSAYMSFISLAFVIASMHVLRLYVHWSNRRKTLAAPKNFANFAVLSAPSLNTTS